MNDAKALKILFDKYWHTSKGWQNNEISKEDFECAKEAGVMFDDEDIDHEQAVGRCISACKSIPKELVVDAFLCSLSSRRLDLRSALGSYACGERLPHHEYKQRENNEYSKECFICGENLGSRQFNKNILNFERHKFAGVRHLQPSYIDLDLSLVKKENVSAPSDEDISIMRNIMLILGSLDSDKLADAEKALRKIIKSNKHERQNIIFILGYCGVLEIPNYDGFHKNYIPCYNRTARSSKSDWPFPSELWRPSFGLNQESINYWFGTYIH